MTAEVTILSSPKPFAGPAGELQLRAIRSWLAAHPSSRIFLYADEEDIPHVAGLHRVEVYTDVTRSVTGVPRFDAIQRHAELQSDAGVFVYLNCDILLPVPIPAALSAGLPWEQWLVVGRRLDLGAGVACAAGVGWLEELCRLRAQGDVVVHAPTGMDYFIYSRGLFGALRPLIVGRAGYDGALLAYALRRGIPAVDATWRLPALHQFHDYGHVRGGQREVWAGAEAESNRRLHGLRRAAPDLRDCNWRLAEGGAPEPFVSPDLLRRLEHRLRYRTKVPWLPDALRLAQRLTLRYKHEDPSNSFDRLIEAWKREYAVGESLES